ncbi:hypothetical protein [Botrimarina hoheduenensis]|uniref:DUF4412 domain-containing protein n=1 Tax=Botrimarina hoheduenensis TaxID=2528000 RepID=A0A5C5WEH0_9BACT|nr:hypothetical protein [Botrimarina hoheduenensis]TWT48469.1 hypothetical protein Pla111_02370 [Botrimarina hoheduenensis]
MRTLFTLLLMLSAAALSSAADFRIETRVYAAGESEPVSQSVTLFADGIAYDFRDRDHRVTIFRRGMGSKPGRFVLLDTNGERRTEIGGERVAVVMTKLQRWAALQDDSFLRFVGDPKFEESFDASTGELRLVSDQLSYRLVTMPVANEEAMKELRSFLDAFSQLHTLLEAGLPPGPRMEVNRVLARRSVVPVEVELYSGEIDGEPSLRADHLVTWILSQQDRAKIDLANAQLAEFEEVDNAQFRGKPGHVLALDHK